jgi:tetratricopeptide (TPR) repeat protein
MRRGAHARARALRGAEVRAKILARQATLLAGPLERPDDAIPLLRRAISLDPQQEALRHSLRALLERLERWPAVLDCLHIETLTAEPLRRAELLEEAAQIAADRISYDASLPWLVRLREEHPEDAALVARIADVHRRAGRPEALLRALEDEIALTSDRSQRWGLHLECARILEVDLNSPARALGVLRAARGEAPHDVAVLRELDRLYSAAGRPAERLEIIEALLLRVSSAERVAYHRTAAELLTGPLSDPARAAEHLTAALAETSERGLARIALLQMLGSAQLRADQLAAWAESTEEELRELDPEAAVFEEHRRDLDRKLAWAYLGPLAEPDAALTHLRAFVNAESETDDTSTVEVRKAEDALFDLLRREGMHAELARRLARRLERESNDPDGWLELALLREEKLHLTVSAASAYREATRLRPDDLQALRGLRRSAERMGDWTEVAATLDHELELGADEPAHVRTALLRRLADVAFHRLQSTTRASRALGAALEADPRDLASLRALEDLFEAMEDWRGALDLYQSEIDVLAEAEPERRQRVWLRIGELARDRTDDLELALRAYESAREITPFAPERHAELAELYRRLGDLPRYVDTFAHYCDAPNTAAGSESHLALASALEELERPRDALARFEEALRVDRRGRTAWEAVARLREELGDAAGAADALAEAAELLSDGEAVAGLLRAATLIEAEDLERAAALSARAANRDPASRAAHARRAQHCAQLGQFEEALHSAQRVLDLEDANPDLDQPRAVETAIVGGSAAQALDRPELAVRFYAYALSNAEARPDVLSAHGAALFAIGDWQGAKRVLEQRLAMPGENSESAQQLVLLGKAAESLGEPDVAIQRYGAALEQDPSLEDAHAGRVRLYERAERLEEAVAALEGWADHETDPTRCAAHLTRAGRAGELELWRGARAEAAESLLRRATEAAPSEPAAWIRLAVHLAASDRPEQAADLAAAGLASIEEPAGRAELSLILGRALEAHEEPREAAEAYVEALESGHVEAALSRARILRTLGNWSGAAETLSGFAETAQSESVDGIAEVYLQLGRLRAGPLEEIDAAIDAYRRALDADPKLREAHEALADLLTHRPDSWSEALVRHREILAENPLRQGSLRGVIRIAQGRGHEDAVKAGQTILRAVGLSTPQERADAPTALELRVVTDGRFENPVWERIRQLSMRTADEIATALGATHAPPPAGTGEPAARFRNAALAAEGELAAPALVPLSTEEVRTTLTLVAQLALEPDQVQGDGELVNALSATLRRRTRRRVRKLLEGVSAEDIAAIDFEAWRTELRTMAHAAALDTTGGNLRAALLALSSDESLSEHRVIDPDVDLSLQIGDRPTARTLLARVVLVWIDTIV